MRPVPLFLGGALKVDPAILGAAILAQETVAQGQWRVSCDAGLEGPCVLVSQELSRCD